MKYTETGLSGSRDVTEVPLFNATIEGPIQRVKIDVKTLTEAHEQEATAEELNAMLNLRRSDDELREEIRSIVSWRRYWKRQESWKACDQGRIWGLLFALGQWSNRTLEDVFRADDWEDQVLRMCDTSKEWPAT